MEIKRILTILLIFTGVLSFSQEEDKARLLALKKANNFVYEGNSLLKKDDAVLAEMEYRKALSEQPNSVAGSYNLGTAYIKNGNVDEAVYRLEAAAKSATSKPEKHKAYHNIGNVLMQAKQCKEAVEAYKNALRNNPADDETRYNLVLAKDCAEKQKDQNQDNQDENKDNKDQKENDQNQDNQENKDSKDQEGDDKEDQKDQGDQEKQEGEDEKDEEGEPKDEKQDKGENGDEKKEQQQPKPQPGQLSPQQIKNLLEAMNNQEQKVQEKMNAEKQKGVIIQSDKDW